AEDSIEIFHVPGAFELPLACVKAAGSGDYDAVIALGVIIRGDTPHFDYVAGQAAAGIMQASIQTEVPVMFGVITADTMQQALERAGEKADNKGHEAALSAVEMVETLDSRIGARAEHWRIERMAVVDRNVLRLAVYEFLFEDTPATVAINEALEIARRFSTFEATQFINGILDAIKHDLDSATADPAAQAEKLQVSAN